MPDRFQFDVFLSHNAQDTPRVRRLAERLKQAGLQTEAGLRLWFEEWNVRSGDIIALKVDAFAHLAPIAAAEGQRPVNKPAQGNALGPVPAPMRALKGRHKTSHWVRRFVAPLQGLFFFRANTQGGARSSLALGWLGLGRWPTHAAFRLRVHRVFTGIWKSSLP